MSDGVITSMQLEAQSFDSLKTVLMNVQEARDSLPAEEITDYLNAQKSVIDARRSAETHEGLLQVC